MRSAVDAEHRQLLGVRVGQAEQTGRGHHQPLAPTERIEGDQDPIADLEMLDGVSHRQDAADTLIADSEGRTGNAPWITHSSFMLTGAYSTPTNTSPAAGAAGSCTSTTSVTSFGSPKALIMAPCIGDFVSSVSGSRNRQDRGRRGTSRLLQRAADHETAEVNR